MLVKIVPFLLILTGCIGYGLASARNYEKKYCELLYFKQVISNLSIALEKGHLTFGECCLEVSKGCKEPYSDFLEYIYEELEDKRLYSFSEAWENGIEILQRKLEWKELATLKNVACFGNAEFAAQPVKTLDELGVALDALINAAGKDKKEKGRLSICLGFSVGCMLCIIFL